ncbi:MAG TPA: sensor histidine kinase [Verrucomicrobiae bacterium]|nr:sensor histidine kinase [Verrucomicrobiae bacterium]
MLSTLSAFFKKQSRIAIVTEASAMVFLTGYLDYITGYQITLFVFYGLPILIAVWYGGLRCGIFIALLSTIVWCWSDERAGHPYLMSWIRAWDTTVRLFFFLFMAVGISALKNQYELVQRLRRLEQQLIRISEHERQRMGQELHDGLCQYFAAISCAAGSLTDELQKHSAAEAEAAAEIAELLKQGVIQTRNLSRGLFPVRKHEGGLESALSELAASMSRLSGIDCRFECVDHVPIYDNEVATHLYRIAQEALNNAKRHGRATIVNIALTAEAGQTKLSIRDNGKGFGGANEKANGMGLEIMDYRAHLIGGYLEIKPQEGGGTIVSCWFQQDKKKSGRESSQTRLRAG